MRLSSLLCCHQTESSQKVIFYQVKTPLVIVQIIVLNGRIENENLLERTRNCSEKTAHELITAIIVQMNRHNCSDDQLVKKWLTFMIEKVTYSFKELSINFSLESCICCLRFCTSAIKCINAYNQRQDNQLQVLPEVSSIAFKLLQIVRCNFPYRQSEKLSLSFLPKFVLEAILELVQYEATIQRYQKSEEDSEFHNVIMPICQIYLHYLDKMLSFPFLQLLQRLSLIDQIKSQILEMTWASIQAHSKISRSESEILTIILCQHQEIGNKKNAAKIWLSIYWYHINETFSQVQIGMWTTLQSYINPETATIILQALTSTQAIGAANDRQCLVDKSYLKKMLAWLLSQSSQRGWKATLNCVKEVEKLIIVCLKCLQRDSEESSYIAALFIFIQEQIASRIYFGNTHNDLYIVGRRYLSVRLLTQMCRDISNICKDDTLIKLLTKSLDWMIRQVKSDSKKCVEMWVTCLLISFQLFYEIFIKDYQDNAIIHKQIQQLINLAQSNCVPQIDASENRVSIEECCRYLTWMHANKLSTETTDLLSSLLFDNVKTNLGLIQANSYTQLIFLISAIKFNRYPMWNKDIPVNSTAAYANHLLLTANMFCGSILDDDSLYQFFNSEMVTGNLIVSASGATMLGLMWMVSDTHNQSMVGEQMSLSMFCSYLLHGIEKLKNTPFFKNQDKTDRDQHCEREQIMCNKKYIGNIRNETVKDAIERSAVQCTLCTLIVLCYYGLSKLVILMGESRGSQIELENLQNIYHINRSLKDLTLNNGGFKAERNEICLSIISAIKIPYLSKFAGKMNILLANANENLCSFFNNIIACSQQSRFNILAIAGIAEAQRLLYQAGKIISHYCHFYQIEEMALKIRTVKIGSKMRPIRMIQKQMKEC